MSILYKNYYSADIIAFGINFEIKSYYGIFICKKENNRYIYTFSIILIPTLISAQDNRSSSTSWKYGHCLKEVHSGGIDGSNYIPITKDDSTGEFEAPQFVKTHPAECDNSTGGTIQEQEPVAYVSGTKARVKACFYTDCTHSYYIRGLGPHIDVNQSSVQIKFPKQLVTPTSNGQVVYDWETANQEFVQFQVKYFRSFGITWQISEDGQTKWIDIDASENPLYVTHKQPIESIPGIDDTGKKYLDGIGYEWFESLIHLSTTQSDDFKTPEKIIQEIWKLFQTNDITNVNNLTLNYYYRWNLPVQSTTSAYLLDYRDGQCYSWCSFLIDLLKIQGLDYENDLVLVNSRPLQWFLVKDWKKLQNPFEDFNTFGRCNIDESYTIISESDYILVDNIGTDYFYTFLYQEIEDEEGVIGQNKEDPESWFQEHCLVYNPITSLYYDPSYGKSYASISDFKSNAIEMWVYYAQKTQEYLYQELDPNNNYLSNYDFTGNGDLNDFVYEFRCYEDLTDLDLKTEIHDR